MIWIYLGIFIVLMAAPFLLSWYYTGKKKRTILALSDDSSDIPFHNSSRHMTNSENVIKMERLDAPAESVYEEPLFIEGNASFGKNAKLSAAHAKTLTLSEQGYVTSFLNADEYLSVGEGCILMGSTECHGNMDIANGVSFYDLFARKIRFSGGPYEAGSDSEERKDLIVGAKEYVMGDISTENDIELDNDTVVFGNVISQKSIKIGSGCHIKGNVFAQECIEIHENVTIGSEKQVKSVVAGDSLLLFGPSTVYGRVRAIRGGRVTEQQTTME
ncbi:MAG: hypothetical protein MJ092_00025 [Lachnospiraceae bacterium]|nr:hypothetical protein [Lachnospiraceae bacterium]